jgi:3-hydroxyisobutyrate dehydrogenase-like beta-hydroxyacid dehydrogenase
MVKQLENKVTLIGLGAMGSALTGAFLSKGYSVTVWNRDTTKAEPFVRQGAQLAADPTSAIGASTITIICVSHYKAMRSILEPVKDALKGKVIVQLSSGTPKDARDTQEWVEAHSASYLDGAILAWPSQIGGRDTTILISGPESPYRQWEETLKTLAGNLTYMGEEVGASEALFAAVLSYLAGSWIGFCHGALVCEKEGLRVDQFGELMQMLAPILGDESKHMGAVIYHRNFSQPESTIQTTGADLLALLRHSEEAGISKDLPQFAADIFQRAIKRGYGGEEHAAVFKVL